MSGGKPATEAQLENVVAAVEALCKSSRKLLDVCRELDARLKKLEKQS